MAKINGMIIKADRLDSREVHLTVRVWVNKADDLKEVGKLLPIEEDVTLLTRRGGNKILGDKT